LFAIGQAKKETFFCLAYAPTREEEKPRMCPMRLREKKEGEEGSARSKRISFPKRSKAPHTPSGAFSA